MYNEISRTISGDENAFIFIERTDSIQIGKINFYYNRFSILHYDSIKSIGRLKIQLLLGDKPWSTQFFIPKNYRYSKPLAQWTLVSLKFKLKNFGIKLIYD